MPRRTHRKRKRVYVPDHMKGKNKKRSRAFHHGALRDEHFAEADRRLRNGEERAA